MTAGFTALGKQVLAQGGHYADAADVKAAEFIAEPCNALVAARRAALPSAPTEDLTGVGEGL